MKKMLAWTLILGAAGTSWGRPPILVPGATEQVAYQSPTLAAPQADPAPPSPGLDAPNAAPRAWPRENSLMPQPDMRSSQAIPHGAYMVPGETPAVLTPVPSQVQPGTILGDAGYAVGVPLYHAVKVRQPRNIAPGAVNKIVAVPDPCHTGNCVYVSICVPPCACERVYCSPRKDRVTFDYGKYAVNVTARRGMLVVNYDD